MFRVISILQSAIKSNLNTEKAKIFDISILQSAIKSPVFAREAYSNIAFQFYRVRLKDGYSY